MEERLELAVGHDGVVGVVVEVAGELLQAFDLGAHAPAAEGGVAGVGEGRRLAAEREVGGGVVAVEEDFFLGVGGEGFFDGGVKDLVAFMKDFESKL